MTSKVIRFFSPQENTPTLQKKTPKTPKPMGHISAGGKLMLPLASIDQLELDPQTPFVRIGIQPGKGPVQSLYLLPTSPEHAQGFGLVKSAKHYTVPFGVILKRIGLDYSSTNYRFTIHPFKYEPGIAGYELQLQEQPPKAPYTGKPRGRKPKTTGEAA